MFRFRSPNVYLPVLFLLILAAIPILAPDPVILRIFYFTFWYAFFAGSWHILGRYAGQLSIGHAAFFGIGAYVTTLLLEYFGITPWAGMFLGAALAAGVAILIGFPCFRLRGLYYALITLAFGEVVRIILLTWKGVTHGPLGIFIPHIGDSLFYFQFTSKVPYYYSMLALMLVLIFVLIRIERSKLGFYLAAIREDEDAATSLGVNAFKYKLIAAGISAFFAALAGFFYINYLFYIDPYDVNIMRSIDPVIISFVGGSSAFGPIIGSFILTPIAEVLTIMLGGKMPILRHIAYGSILIVVLLTIPEGLSTPILRAYNSLVRKLSRSGE